jgi:hypothetical protein
MLGRHRDGFNRKVCEATRADAVEWRDFPSGDMREDGRGNILWDREWHQLEFLPQDDPARMAWKRAWPSHRMGHNWDAIGQLRFGSKREWLLVEAKANLEELRSACKAEDAESRDTIGNALSAANAALGVAGTCDWMKPYYQFCNRLVALHVMNNAGTPARLLYVYFCGDRCGQGRTCPTCEQDWREQLADQDRHVGLSLVTELSGRVHKLFMDVRCYK